MASLGTMFFSALLIAGVALAQSGGGYDLHWNAQDAGGGTMTGANGYDLNGTVAQPDANALGVISGNGSYELLGGVAPGLGEGDVVFRNGFEAGP
jgi:hypothetical protein